MKYPTKPWKHKIGDTVTYYDTKYNVCKCCGQETSEDVEKQSRVVNIWRDDPDKYYRFGYPTITTEDVVIDESGHTTYLPRLNTLEESQAAKRMLNVYMLEDGHKVYD